MNIRIAKFISNSGYCSRRDAEKLISDGNVIINDKICLHPSQKVNEKDTIKIKNKIIKSINKVELWKLYKPIKYICSNKDNFNRNIIFDLLPKKYPKLITVGRLDYMSEGLILLTNNGDYARYLELPSSNIERTYKVCVSGNIKLSDIKHINKGIIINKINYKRVNLKIEKKLKNYTWMIFKLKEGKNREIRNICQFCSWKVHRLIRVGYGPYKLGNLKIGEFKTISLKT